MCKGPSPMSHLPRTVLPAADLHLTCLAAWAGSYLNRLGSSQWFVLFSIFTLNIQSSVGPVSLCLVAPAAPAPPLLPPIRHQQRVNRRPCSINERMALVVQRREICCGTVSFRARLKLDTRTLPREREGKEREKRKEKREAFARIAPD